MTFGKQLVTARKKMRRLVLWATLIVLVEVFVVSNLLILIIPIPGIVGLIIMALVITTFVVAIRRGNQISDPLLETGGDLLEKANVESREEG